MPAASTHVEFARDTLEHLSADVRARITNLPLYFLGSQGPDLFFFSRYAYLPGSLYQYGGMMHTQKILPELLTLKQLCTNDADLYSYYLGFMTHYSLDSHVHPSVYYFSRIQAERTGRPEIECHFIDEACMDLATFKRKHLSINDYRVFNDLHITKEDAKKLGIMYKQFFKEVYDLDFKEEQIEEAALGVSKITRHLRPNSRLKFKLVQGIESLIRIPHLITGMMWFDRDGENAEILNHEHLTYDVPGQEGKQENRSFEELYDATFPYAVKVLTNLEESDILWDFHGEFLK